MLRMISPSWLDMRKDFYALIAMRSRDMKKSLGWVSVDDLSLDCSHDPYNITCLGQWDDTSNLGD